MALNDRQEFILQALRNTGHVEVDALSREWNVTTQTVRRDLSELCDAGLAIRTHGGARRVMSTSALAYQDRRETRIAEKQAVAVAAADLIPNDASVALNIGTTTELVAEALRRHEDLTILSNNINIVHILREARLRSLIVVGGEVRLSDGAIVGEDAVAAIANYKVDYAIIGTSSLEPDGSILDFDPREVAVARAILANARKKILVADQSKFEVSAPFRICAVRDLDYVVMDATPPAPFAKALEDGGTKLITVTGTSIN
ncbi:DeoR/GlpR family DNA-binding transcription regulator [Aliiroseovarius sp. YM-037]|uniref:DeoR/GlpR family DNA-binding transcription regulator n=1 Tax=Aliiroseovarius sp. YM-037 TaxID=3341728 RepID=UPI003A7F8ABD